MERNSCKRKRGLGKLRDEVKRNRLSGKSYETLKGKTIPLKKAFCGEVKYKCGYSCSNLSANGRKSLFLRYYELGRSEKGTYLMGLISIIPVQRRRHGTYDQPESSRRQHSVIYNVPDGNGRLLRICQGTFCKIFDLSSRRLQVLQTKKKEGQTTYVDFRGNKNIRRKYSDVDRNLIKAYISSFPREESHYSRGKSSKQYFSPDLNINRLFRLFVEKNPTVKVSYWYFSHVFKEEFPGCSFGPPRTDTCNTCDRLHMSIKVNDNESCLHKERLELHQRPAEKAFSLLKNNTKDSQLPNSRICTITMDLQQVMFTPTLTHSAMFYARQVSNYNFCVHIGDNNESFMLMWHEGIANRGGNEIASCLLKILPKVTHKKELQIWCDNCAGQNKNRMVLFVLIYLVAKGYFSKISLNFLVRGHTFMACDRDFALVEKRKRVSKTMVPFELHDMVRTTRIVKPFKVVAMNKSDFFNISKAADSLISTSHLNISKASAIIIDDKNLKKIQVKNNHNDFQEWTIVNVLKKNISLEDIRTKELLSLETGNRITEPKKNDLLGMLPYMDPQYRPFYETLLRDQQN